MNLDVTKHNHFKLYILTEDRFTFESELLKNKIDFYSDAQEQINSAHSIRYYLKDSDRIVIDKIISTNKISSGLESTGINKFEFQDKPFVRLLIIIIGLISLMVLINSLI